MGTQHIGMFGVFIARKSSQVFVLGPNLGECSHKVFSCVFKGSTPSVLAVQNCSNHLFIFSFLKWAMWLLVSTTVLKGSRASGASVWCRSAESSRYSCCHLDKGGSQSLIIYLMCDAIFPDFWVIWATDGRTSRVGEVGEREWGGEWKEEWRVRSGGEVRVGG